MKAFIRTFAIGATLLAGCATISATHDFDPAVNFDRYRTFSWVSDHPLVDPSPNASPLLAGKIEQAARDLLSAKGYRFVADREQADFVVGFGFGATDQQRIDAYGPAYRGAWSWHGAHEAAPPHVDGRLVVDVFDRRTHRPAWHGWAARTISITDRQDPGAAIRGALTAILANFPPS